MQWLQLTPEQIADYKVSVILRAIDDSLRDLSTQKYIREKFRNVTNAKIIDTLWKVQNDFVFIKEARKEDYCKTTDEFIRDKYGDCEDFVVFNSTILKTFGIPYRIKTTDTMNTGYFNHILLEVYYPKQKKWLPLDGTYRQKGLGGEPPSRKQRIYPIY